ncbi:heavy-metal-associated domain-containing protein [Nocardioides sp. NPDC057767]|uniref:heavy-metal-associated domain-containing protein n=1 Tax=unclassified Nocardioides TaxID=2615069 RepID=UPI00366F1412
MSVQFEVRIDGMTCNRCVESVTNALGNLDGVHGVEVDLNPGAISNARVTADEPVEPRVLRSTLAKAGFSIARET